MSEILRLTALATTSAIAVNYMCSTSDRVWFWVINHSLLRILLDNTSDSRLSISDDTLLFLLYLRCFLMAARGRPLLIVSRSELEHLLSLFHLERNCCHFKCVRQDSSVKGKRVEFDEIHQYNLSNT